MVSWGAGVANLPPYYESYRMGSALGMRRGQQQLPPVTEMTTVNTPPPPPTTPLPARLAQSSTNDGGAAQAATTSPPVQPPSNPERAEAARQRAVALLGRPAPADPDAEEARTMPRWRKAVLRVFPGVAR